MKLSLAVGTSNQQDVLVRGTDREPSQHPREVQVRGLRVIQALHAYRQASGSPSPRREGLKAATEAFASIILTKFWCPICEGHVLQLRQPQVRFGGQSGENPR
jgi:hypothetical protein